MFTEKDITQIEVQGASLESIKKQLDNFKKGFPFLRLIKAATIGDGIVRPVDSKIAEWVNAYETIIAGKSIVKFVPASGAASRMFKDLYSFLNEGKNEDLDNPDKKNKLKAVNEFFEKLFSFAFFEDLKASLAAQGRILEELIANKQYQYVVEAFLEEPGLNYGNLPKGLLKFHKYGNSSRTPVEEHIVEGANYARSGNNVNLHFTVSPEHRQKFEQHVAQVLHNYEKLFNIKINISFSEQKPSTDTIAVGLDNEPFRNNDGSLLFRPGGHGALIENLNDINADIIFIKNIDNVVPDNIKGDTFAYKKAIATLLIQYQQRIFNYLQELEKGEANETLINEIGDFLEKELFVEPAASFKTKDLKEKADYFFRKLNRPLRVCGMVKNEGEPGGGPFWATNQDGSISLQVVESSQVDMQNEEQKNIFKNATHFNPVDLVCAVKDYKGNKFHLPRFVDPQTGFISQKSKDGKELKAMELPGLWNGSMADWNTIFVEVPMITFNPVKTVNDLLRKEHQ